MKKPLSWLTRVLIWWPGAESNCRHADFQHTWRPKPQCLRGLQRVSVSRATDRATQKPHFFALLPQTQNLLYHSCLQASIFVTLHTLLSVSLQLTNSNFYGSFSAMRSFINACILAFTAPSFANFSRVAPIKASDIVAV